MSNLEIRPAQPADSAAIKQLAIATGLFMPEEMDGFDEMLSGFFDGSMPDHRWLVLQRPGESIAGAAYYAPEPFADRVWNLYFIAVAPEQQGSGTGKALISYVERQLRTLGEDTARVLIVETSGRDKFERTRRFYQSHGFDEEARIREYYGPSDDKVVFGKSLVAMAT